MNALRSLDVDQQVALLFVLLFGALVLATVASVFLVLQRADSENSERALRLKRELRAVWVGALVFWLAWVSGPVGATLAFGVLSFLALREFITLAHTRSPPMARAISREMVRPRPVPLCLRPKVPSTW